MMFEWLERAARRLADARAERRRGAIMAALRERLPRDIALERTDDGVRLSGRALKRRLALDPEARASIGRAE